MERPRLTPHFFYGLDRTIRGKFVSFNRLHNAGNPHQGSAKRVLCVCSAGLLRSPTAAEVLSRAPFNFNTRAAGIVENYALIHADAVLIAWADEIVCMTQEEARQIKTEKPVKVLNIEDSYPFRHPKLRKLIRDRYREASK